MKAWWKGLFFGLFLVNPVLAEQAGESTTPVKGAAPAPVQAGFDQSVSRQQSEVRLLQREVEAQERSSQQANERLEQQDEAIAELQKQLELIREPAMGDD